MQSPENKHQVGRRIIIKGLVATAVSLAVPEIVQAAAERISTQPPANYNQTVEQRSGQANVQYEGGNYYANGVGTEIPIQKFGDLYQAVTGVSFVPNIERFYTGAFSGIYGEDPAYGLCNAFSNREVCKLRLWSPNSLEGIDFSVEDIKALMAVFHYGDRWTDNYWHNEDRSERRFNNDLFIPAENRYEIGQPIYLHKMLEQWFSPKLLTGVVIDRSNARGATWTHPVESYAMVIRRNFGRRSSVTVNLKASNYPEPGLPMTQPYRDFQVQYEIDENNIFDNGRYIGGNIHVMRMWVPNPQASYPCYLIRNNIFPADAIELLRQVIQYTPEEMVGVYGVYDQQRTEVEIRQFNQAQARGECQ